ncbi:DUF305 domain-containing protein [Micromonospora lupini]|uniref:DUF305 domain-containing protein n=1 Tax=Micromonospora lupini str. Lupac 08 TaxID=1150864 RepID=I0KZ16_9ACTN|nr:DUF305 domain-containing protein [Micromonospora lupini]CCH16813.1 conserved exported hypothetical protein [Micromonospora lupini str. Lupac 08]
MPRVHLLSWLVAASLLAACAGPSPQPAAPASPAASAAGSSAVGSAPAGAELSGIDVVFLSTMVGHSERTLQIVRLARDRLRDHALRTLAAAIEATEADELSAMRGWLPTAGPGVGAAGHDHAGHGDDTALERLRDVGDADVDRVLREVLAEHQRAAADLARAQVDVGRDERVRDLARRIERSRTAEVELLQGYAAQISSAPAERRSS